MAIPPIYRDSLALLTDLYQLTMAYGYFKEELSSRQAVFHLTFREHPFGGQYAIACGLQFALDWLSQVRFSAEDIEYLAGLLGADEKPLFDPPFLEYLRGLRLQLDVDAIPEGTVVFANEPLLRVEGPLLQCQLVETALLNIVNFQTLIATKASRICRAARGEPVLEFGLRRAQGVDGSLSASRAAFIGGCAATSNVLAGRLFDLPVRGTHAHSWVMAFDDELTSLRAYADAMPNNCVFLVDTYDTIRGVEHAIQVGRRLRQHGHKLLGIRLDSGDLADLSQRARSMLDEAGFTDATIVASNDLDEERIEQLVERGAKIGVWGVGTRLATAYDQPALGGVYKLGALQDERGGWQYRAKVSEQPIKATTPGILQVRRFFNDDGFQYDAIYDRELGISDCPKLVDYVSHRKMETTAEIRYADLLTGVIRQGETIYDPPTAAMARGHTERQLDSLADPVRRLSAPQRYAVGLESRLHQLKTKLLEDARRSDK